jgi:hypothetical protein
LAAAALRDPAPRLGVVARHPPALARAGVPRPAAEARAVCVLPARAALPPGAREALPKQAKLATRRARVRQAKPPAQPGVVQTRLAQAAQV